MIKLYLQRQGKKGYMSCAKKDEARHNAKKDGWKYTHDLPSEWVAMTEEVKEWYDKNWANCRRTSFNQQPRLMKFNNLAEAKKILKEQLKNVTFELQTPNMI